MRITMRALCMSTCAAALVAGLTPNAFAQSADSGGQANAANTETVVVTGSRFGGRTVTDSDTPVDVVSASQLANTGATELQQMLKVAVPSFSTPSPATGGPLDFLQPPTLRGLGPGEVLVLLNGKRYHTDAELNTGVQIGRGDVEYNFNTIPTAALSSTEVLRDGAAAQYGSDAISGVINLRLSDRVGTDMNVHSGISTLGDGQEFEASVGQGFDLGNGGFIRITADYKASGSTNRARPDTRQQYFGTNSSGALVLPSGNFGSGIGLTPSNGTLDPREAGFDRDVWHFGNDPYHSEALVINSEYPINSAVTAYAFADLSHLIGDSPQFFRGPSNDATIRAIYPNGFDPIQKVRFFNMSETAGLKGDDIVGFKWDLSTTYGGSYDQIGYFNSDNPSMGAASPTSFANAGRANFTQSTTNLDLTREFNLGDLGPLDVALGAEYRAESYASLAGQQTAYENGGVPVLDGPDAGKPAPVGAQTGAISPQDSNRLSRGATSEYAEVQKDFWTVLNLDAAIRHESYTDFGEVTDFKLAGRLALPDNFALRASYGTGFRAPALAQEGFASTVTSFSGTNIVFTKFVPAGSALGNLVGAPALRAEASNDASVGLVYGGDNLTASIDAYQIKLKHRIVDSSTFASGPLTSYLASQGFPGISSVAFETNAADTTTTGLDVTGSYRYETGNYGSLTSTLAANFNDTEFDHISGTPTQLTSLGITTPVINLTNEFLIAHSTPKNKETLDLSWALNNWNIDLNNTRYGSVAQIDFASATPAQIASFGNSYNLQLYPIAGSANSQVAQYFRPDIVTDLAISYAFDQWKITLGSSNLFNIYPQHQVASSAATVAAGTNGADNAGIFPYSYLAPYGTVGRFVYANISFSL